MSMEFYEQIVQQIAAHRDTVEGVSMIHYNEPTIDRFFLQRIDLLKKYGASAGGSQQRDRPEPTMR